jgi:hypothetical protein
MLKGPAQSAMFELVERDAWLAFFAAVPHDCAPAFGIRSLCLNDVGLLASREVPMMEFNRAMCLGIVAPATETELGEASAWLRTNAAPGWALQVAPAAHTRILQDWLGRHAMTVSGTGWAKFTRGISPAAPVRTSFQVRLVNRESADAFGQVVQAGFDLPVATAKWFAALFGRPGWHLDLAYEGETPVACGAAFAQHGVAWFGMDATLTDFRRRGAQTALIKFGNRYLAMAAFPRKTSKLVCSSTTMFKRRKMGSGEACECRRRVWPF